LHEMGLAVSIYDTCRKALSGQEEGRIEKVKVAVGELSAIDPELLVFAWQAVTAEGPDADSELDVEWRPARQFCPECKQERPRPEGSWLFVCPECEHPLSVEGGFELEVLQITFLPYDEGGGTKE
jgi:hydrogenase nickel incorporation protein HypA/HybF